MFARCLLDRRVNTLLPCVYVYLRGSESPSGRILSRFIFVIRVSEILLFCC